LDLKNANERLKEPDEPRLLTNAVGGFQFVFAVLEGWLALNILIS